MPRSRLASYRTLPPVGPRRPRCEDAGGGGGNGGGGSGGGTGGGSGGTGGCGGGGSGGSAHDSREVFASGWPSVMLTMGIPPSGTIPVGTSLGLGRPHPALEGHPSLLSFSAVTSGKRVEREDGQPSRATPGLPRRGGRYFTHSILLGSKGGWAMSSNMSSPPSALMLWTTPFGMWRTVPGLTETWLPSRVAVPCPLTM
jgi:hypothetical protein